MTVSIDTNNNFDEGSDAPEVNDSQLGGASEDNKDDLAEAQNDA